MQREPKKINIMYFRVSDEDKMAILRAAVIMEGVSVSEFIRKAAVDAAWSALEGKK